MGKLWIFGDSFSDSCGLEPNGPYVHYLQNELNVDDVSNLSWQKLLASELNLELVECAISGCSNTEIITSILLNINKFKKDDYIIVGWTLPSRISLPFINPKKPLVSIPNDVIAMEIDSETQSTNYHDFYLKTVLPALDIHSEFWTIVGDNLVKYLSNTYNIKSWFWGNIKTKIHTITHHTNDKIQDDHPSIYGHLVIKDIVKQMNWGSMTLPRNRFPWDNNPKQII